MKGGPVGWVVAFFTRPIRLSDFKTVLNALKPREKAPAAPVKELPPVVVERPVRAARPRTAPAAGPRPPVAPMRDPALDIGVSEAPLDTLPADLQSEFGLTTSPAPLDLTPPRGSGPNA